MKSIFRLWCPIVGVLAAASFPSGKANGADAGQEAVDFRYSPPEWQTLICLPDDPCKSLVDKSGALLYHYGQGGREFGATVAVEVTSNAVWQKQELQSPRVPIVCTCFAADGLRIVEEAFACTDAPRPVVNRPPPSDRLDPAAAVGPSRDDLLLVYVTNTGQETRTLAPKLVVDTTLGCRLEDQRVVVNNHETVACSLKMTGLVNGRQVQLEPMTVPAGQTARFCALYSGGGEMAASPATVKEATAARDRAVEYWGKAPLPFGRVQVPDAGIQALVDSSIRNIWQAREIKKGVPVFQVGPTCYRGLWIVDGAFLLEAAAMLGAGDQARHGVAYELTYQKSDGRIEVMQNYWKENGIVLWTCARHAQLTQDKVWLESVWPKLERIAEFIRTLRQRTLTNDSPLDDGLIPPGFPDGGIGGLQYEYTNPYWNLLGLRSFVQAARWLGKTDEAAAWQKEYDDFLAAFRKAAARDMRKDANGNSYLPILMGEAGAKELPQRAQWGFCHAVYPGQIFAKDDPLVAGNMAMLEATEREGMVYGTGWDATGIWNYFASFYGHAWLWQGNGRKAAQILYAYANHAAPVLDWREEQSLRGEKFRKVGDMPHNWASAEFIRLTVHLLELDRGDELHLFEGLPPAWTQPGMVTRLNGIATPFGPLTMELKIAADGKTARLRVEPLSDATCRKIIVHLAGWAGDKKDALIELDPKRRTNRVIPLARDSSASGCNAQDARIPNPDMEGLPPRTLPAGPAFCPPVDWVQTNLRIAHLPPADWDQIQDCLKAGYQVVAVNTVDRWDRVGARSNDYPAQVVSDADAYLRRFVKMSHDAGAKAVFYVWPTTFPRDDAVFREKHPEWLQVNEDGSRSKEFVNFRNPEVVNWLCQQLAYLAREYKADGFWFDGYSPMTQRSYDDATRQAFREYSKGHDLPRERDINSRDPIGLQYLRWHEAYFAQLADQIRQAVRAANPTTVIYGNYSANRMWYASDWAIGEYPAYYANAIDLPSVELYWDNPGDALFQQFVYAFTQGMSHDQGARAWVQPHVHGTVGTPPSVELMLRNLAGAPWGVYAEYVEWGLPEELCRQYVSEVKAREEWWKQSEAVPYVGIVASEQTRLLLGRDTLLEYFSHTLGAFRGLFEAHWPLRILSDYDLENANLQGVRVLVLRDVRVLSDRSTEVIRRFVRAGGGLVASRGTGLYNHNLLPRGNFSLADVFRADYLASHEVTNTSSSACLWLTATDHPILNDPAILGQQKTAGRAPKGSPPAQGWLDFVGSTTLVRTNAGGQTLARMSTNENSGNTYPAIIASTYGQGRVVYLPAAIDKALYFFPNTYLRSMLVNACKWVAHDAQPPVEVDAPMILAVTYRRQAALHRTVVHLLNDQSSYGRHSIYQKIRLADGSLLGTWPVREEIIPLNNITVRCRIGGITKATQQPENVPLPLTPMADGGVQVVVPTVNMYSLVVFE